MIGNLKYTTSKEAIQIHFEACGMLITLRVSWDATYQLASRFQILHHKFVS